MTTAIQTEVQAEVQAEDVSVEPSELVLRPLEAAEMIHVGGGYCAADY